MPRYFFHLSYDRTPTMKNEGLDLPDDQAAWIEATAACGELLRDLNGGLEPGGEWTMIVKDEAGLDIYELDFRTKALRQSH